MAYFIFLSFPFLEIYSSYRTTGHYPCEKAAVGEASSPRNQLTGLTWGTRSADSLFSFPWHGDSLPCKELLLPHALNWLVNFISKEAYGTEPLLFIPGGILSVTIGSGNGGGNSVLLLCLRAQSLEDINLRMLFLREHLRAVRYTERLLFAME